MQDGLFNQITTITRFKCYAICFSFNFGTVAYRLPCELHTAWGSYGETSWHIIFLIKCLNNDDNTLFYL